MRPPPLPGTTGNHDTAGTPLSARSDEAASTNRAKNASLASASASAGNSSTTRSLPDPRLSAGAIAQPTAEPYTRTGHSRPVRNTTNSADTGTTSTTT